MGTRMIEPRSGPGQGAGRKRPLVAFFAFSDVFEDLYPRYNLDQQGFLTRWRASGNLAFLSVLQRDVADVTWYMLSIQPQISEGRHESAGCLVKFLPSSWLHRLLWRAFYCSRIAWLWQAFYRPFAVVASYLAPASLSLWRALKRDRPDFVFVLDWGSGRYDVLLLLARLLGVPLIARHGGSRPERYLGKLAKRWTIPRADGFIVAGPEEREMLIRKYRVPPERVNTILTPIDTVVYCPQDRAAAFQAAGLDPARRYLLFVGRLEDHIKRVSALLRAFARLAPAHPDVDLVVVGDGPDAEKLKTLAQECVPGRVRFPGWISDAREKVSFYNAAQCLVLPSIREGFPAVVAEAMACGTPVVASRVGAVPELVIEGETGWLAPPGNDEALQSALEQVLRDPAAVASMRSHARRVAEDRVSSDRVGAALAQCFSFTRAQGESAAAAGVELRDVKQGS